MFCEEIDQSLVSRAPPATSEDTTSVWGWTTASLSIAFAGVAVWQGLVLYDEYQLAWDANRKATALSMLANSEALVAEQNRASSAASNAARRAERMMWITGGLSAGFAITASILWPSDRDESSIGITASGVHYKSVFW